MTDRRFDFSNARVKTPWHPGPGSAEERRPEAYVVAVDVLDLLDGPGGRRDRQLLFNDAVDVLEVREGVAFVRAAVSGYVGYVAASGLRPQPAEPIPDQWVSSRLTHAYDAPDIKSPVRMALSMGTQLSDLKSENGLVETEAGWVPEGHVTDEIRSDPVAVAEQFLGTPYLWGGNSGSGIDCSGLVWIAFAMCGKVLMPDSDLQMAHDGVLIEGGSIKRGDLWFWKDHVAMVVDADHLIHATAHYMAVVFEPPDAMLARTGPTMARKRVTLPHE